MIAADPATRNTRSVTWLTLATSASTLLCCALPAQLVALGAGRSPGIRRQRRAAIGIGFRTQKRSVRDRGRHARRSGRDAVARPLVAVPDRSRVGADVHALAENILNGLLIFCRDIFDWRIFCVCRFVRVWPEAAWIMAPGDAWPAKSVCGGFWRCRFKGRWIKARCARLKLLRVKIGRFVALDPP